MERGKLDMLFIADTIGTPGSDDREQLSFTSKVGRFEPMTVLSALTQVTDRLGLAATMATTFHEPYNVARMFASLDYISGGRAGRDGRNDALKNNSRCQAKTAVITQA